MKFDEDIYIAECKLPNGSKVHRKINNIYDAQYYSGLQHYSEITINAIFQSGSICCLSHIFGHPVERIFKIYENLIFVKCYEKPKILHT